MPPEAWSVCTWLNLSLPLIHTNPFLCILVNWWNLPLPLGWQRNTGIKHVVVQVLLQTQDEIPFLWQVESTSWRDYLGTINCCIPDAHKAVKLLPLDAYTTKFLCLWTESSCFKTKAKTTGEPLTFTTDWGRNHSFTAIKHKNTDTADKHLQKLGKFVWDNSLICSPCGIERHWILIGIEGVYFKMIQDFADCMWIFIKREI